VDLTPLVEMMFPELMHGLLEYIVNRGESTDHAVATTEVTAAVHYTASYLNKVDVFLRMHSSVARALMY